MHCISHWDAMFSFFIFVLLRQLPKCVFHVHESFFSVWIATAAEVGQLSCSRWPTAAAADSRTPCDVTSKTNRTERRDTATGCFLKLCKLAVLIVWNKYTYGNCWRGFLGFIEFVSVFVDSTEAQWRNRNIRKSKTTTWTSKSPAHSPHYITLPPLPPPPFRHPIFWSLPHP